MHEKSKFNPVSSAISLTLGCMILVAGGLIGYPYWMSSSYGAAPYWMLWVFLMLLILGLGLTSLGVRLAQFALKNSDKSPVSKEVALLHKEALKYSLILGVGYVVVFWGYLTLSANAEGGLAQWIQSMRNYTLVKELVFTSVTGAGIFAWAYYLLRLIISRSAEASHYQEALEQAGQQATAGVFAASVAHDSINVLASMRFCLELIERNVPIMSQLGPNQELLDTMKKAVVELAALNRQVLEASNPKDTVYLQELDLVTEVRTTLSLARANNRIKHCQLTFEGDSSLVCKIHSTWISEMLLNLVLNAGDATSNAGEILVKVYRSGDFALIEVHDNGRGIQPKDRERIFDPFFTTKREGNGLGLLTVKSCVDKHSGFLQIGTSHLGGALFSIWLPAKARRASSTSTLMEPQIWENISSVSTESNESFAAVGS